MSSRTRRSIPPPVPPKDQLMGDSDRDQNLQAAHAVVEQELDIVKKLKRLSMGSLLTTTDPDLPGDTPISPKQQSSTQRNSQQDARDSSSFDPSQLLWVPARVHPELAPKEWKSFVHSKVKDLQSQISNQTNEGGNVSRGSSLRRSNSKLSKQIRNPQNYTDGADLFESKRKSLRLDTSTDVSQPSLEKLSAELATLSGMESLATDPSMLVKAFQMADSEDDYYDDSESPIDYYLEESSSPSTPPHSSSTALPEAVDLDTPIAVPTTNVSLRRSKGMVNHRKTVKNSHRGRKKSHSVTSYSSPPDNDEFDSDLRRSPEKDSPPKSQYQYQSQLRSQSQSQPQPQLEPHSESQSQSQSQQPQSIPYHGRLARRSSEPSKPEIPKHKMVRASTFDSDNTTERKTYTEPLQPSPTGLDQERSRTIKEESNKGLPNIPESRSRGRYSHSVSQNISSQQYIRRHDRHSERERYKDHHRDPAQDQILVQVQREQQKVPSPTTSSFGQVASGNSNVISPTNSSFGQLSSGSNNVTSPTTSPFGQSSSVPSPQLSSSIDRQRSYGSSSNKAVPMVPAPNLSNKSDSSDSSPPRRQHRRGTFSRIFNSDSTSTSTPVESEIPQSKSATNITTAGPPTSNNQYSNSTPDLLLSSSQSVPGNTSNEKRDAAVTLRHTRNRHQVEGNAFLQDGKSSQQQPQQAPSNHISTPSTNSVSSSTGSLGGSSIGSIVPVVPGSLSLHTFKKKTDITPVTSLESQLNGHSNSVTEKEVKKEKESSGVLSIFSKRKGRKESKKEKEREKQREKEEKSRQQKQRQYSYGSDQSQSTERNNSVSGSTVINGRDMTTSSSNRSRTRNRSNSRSPSRSRSRSKSDSNLRSSSASRVPTTLKSKSLNQSSSIGLTFAERQLERRIAREQFEKVYNESTQIQAPSLLGYSLPPMSKSSIIMFHHRFPVHVERAIYRLSHLKLANPKRPLVQQVLLSNFMYAYLNLVNHILYMQQLAQGNQQTQPQLEGQEAADEEEEVNGS